MTIVKNNKIVWNQFVPVCDSKVKANRPDIIWETEDVVKVIEISCPADKNVIQMLNQKETKYVTLMRDLRRTRKKRVEYFPIVIGGTGAVPLRTVEAMKDLDLDIKTEWAQKVVTMETIKVIKSLI